MFWDVALFKNFVDPINRQIKGPTLPNTDFNLFYS